MSKDSGAELNEKGVTPNIAPTVKDNEGSTTKAAIAEGTVNITDTKDQKQDVGNFKRNIDDRLNRLKEIFDKDSVAEKQELIGMLEKEGNQLIHEYADKKEWKDGSEEKVLLHAAFGALIGDMSGGSAAGGALAGGVNEYVVGYLEKTKGEDWMEAHSDSVQWISAGVGVAVGSGAGDVLDSASVSVAGTKWNYFMVSDKNGIVGKIAKTILERKDGVDTTEEDIDNAMDVLNDIMMRQEPGKGQSDVRYAEDIGSYAKGIETLTSLGYTKQSAESFFKEYNRYLRNLDWEYPMIRSNIEVHIRGKMIDGKFAAEEITLDGTLPSVDLSYTGIPKAPDTYQPGEFDIGKTVTMEVFGQKADWLPETLIKSYGAETVGTKVFFGLGGVIGVPQLASELQEDSQKYSGDDLIKAMQYDFIPVLFAGISGGVGSRLGMGMVGAGVGAVIGEAWKSHLKSDLSTDKEKRARTYYEYKEE